MEIKTLEVAGFVSALKGMRNPMNSWDKSDSGYGCYDGALPMCKKCNPKTCTVREYVIGEEDMKLAQRLVRAGSEHRKFLRQIQVWAEIDMPRYIWQEMDTYKIGTVANSCSTMHKLHEKEFELSDFYHGKDNFISGSMFSIVEDLNEMREYYLETKDYNWIIRMKRILPESYIQKRVWSGNYEVLRNIYHQRKNHRLKEEWGCICEWIETLPYAKELIISY